MQLFRIISSSQVKLKSPKVLQQRIIGITYYTMSTFVGYTPDQYFTIEHY